MAQSEPLRLCETVGVPYERESLSRPHSGAAPCAEPSLTNHAPSLSPRRETTPEGGYSRKPEPPRQPSDTDLNEVAQEAEWAKLRYGMADAASKRTSLFAEQVQAQLAVVQAELLSLICSLPTVGDEPANPHLQLTGATEPQWVTPSVMRSNAASTLTGSGATEMPSTRVQRMSMVSSAWA